MINLDETLKVIKTQIKQLNIEMTSMVFYHSKTQKPNYSECNVLVPDICKNPLNSNVCLNYYKNLKKEITLDTCPFGIKLCIDDFQASNKTIKIITHLNQNKELISEKLISNFPRKSKKSIKRDIQKLQTATIEQDTSIKHHKKLVDLLNVLLYGRAGIASKGFIHQIFSPINAINSDIDYLKKDPTDLETVQRLETSLVALTDIAKQIQVLMLDEIAIGDNALRKVPVNRVISEIIESLKSLSNEKNINIVNKYNNISKYVYAIPDYFKIVLSNIIDNAVKYSFTGYEANKNQIIIDYKSEKHFLIISVTNFGTGITKEEIENNKLFELGYRGEYSGDRNREGTGTGLHISYQIIKKHKGYIKISSEIQKFVDSVENSPHKNEVQIYWPISD
jgi:signal transduction histidine kinase